MKRSGKYFIVVIWTALAILANIFSYWSGLYSLLKTYADQLGAWSGHVIIMLTALLLLAALSCIILIRKYKDVKRIHRVDEKKVRQSYLNWLKADVDNRLSRSIHKIRLIDLKMKESDDLLDRLVFKEVGGDEFTMLDLYGDFPEKENRVLILGDPGSGKTTTLLKLTEKLCDSAVHDDNAVIPILVNLSHWALSRDNGGNDVQPRSGRFLFAGRLFSARKQKKMSFEEWLVHMLVHFDGAGVDRENAAKWVEKRNVALFLDGFDEAREDVKLDVVEALRKYITTDYNLTVAVCCRTLDYNAFYQSANIGLPLQAAVRIQPLTPEQINGYLDKAKAAELKKLMEVDSELMKMAENPLNLSIMTLTYGDGCAPPPRFDGLLSKTFRRRHLFSSYVTSMMQRKARRDLSNRKKPECDVSIEQELKTAYSITQVQRYLGFIAKTLSVNNVVSTDLKNTGRLIWNHRKDTFFSTINNAIAAVIFMCAFFITISIAPRNTVDDSIVNGLIESAIMAVVFYMFIWHEKEYETDDDGTSDLFKSAILFIFFAFASSFIFGGLNFLFSEEHGSILSEFIGNTHISFLEVLSTPVIPFLFKGCIGYIMSIIFIIIAATFVIKNWEKNIDDIVYFSAIFAGSITGTFILGAPTAELTAHMIGFLLVYFIWIDYDSTGWEDSNLALMLWGVIGSIIGGMIAYPFSVFSGILFMITAGFFKEKAGNFVNGTVINPLIIFFLKMEGNLPIRLNRFRKYAAGALLLKDISGEYEFIHRNLRDYFAVPDTVRDIDKLSVHERLAFVEELARLKDASCDILLDLIEDEEKSVRKACVDALGKTGSKTAVDTLLHIIVNTGADLRSYAVKALENIDDIACLNQFMDILKNKRHPKDVRNALCVSIACMGQLDILLKLEPSECMGYLKYIVMRDPDKTIKKKAQLLLNQLKG